MTHLRIALLATTALTAMQLTMTTPSHAQSAPVVVAQKEELGPDGKPKQPPKAAPPAAPPAQPAPPPRQGPPPPPPHPAAPPPPPPQPPARPTPPPPQHPAAPPPPPPQPPTAPPPPPPPRSATPPAPPSPPPAAAPQERGRELEPEKTAPPPARPGQPTAPPTPPATPPAGAPATPRAAPGAAAPNAAPAATPPGGGQTALPPNAAPLVRRAPPAVTAPIPVVPRATQALTPIAPGAAPAGPRRLEDFRGQRQESDQGGRKVFTEPGRVIVVDPSGQSFIRHDEEQRFRFGARDIQTQQVGGETRTVVFRPDGSQVITVVGPDGGLLRRIRRDQQGREIIIIDNSYRDPRDVGGFYVDLPPPVIRIPYDRYIVEADVAGPDLIYDTLEAPPVDRIDRGFTLDENRYSPSVRRR